MNRKWIFLLWLVLLTVCAIRYAEPVGDGDLFWQMAYGKQLLERGTLIPDHTIYSWTHASNKTIYCSWVAEIFFYKTFQLSQALGLDGLTLLFAFRYFCMLVVLLLAWQFLHATGASRRTEGFLFLIVLAISSYVGTILKPEIFSLVFLNLTAWCYYSFKMKARQGRPYWYYLLAFPVTMVFWVNSHGVFIFGGAALGVCLFAEMFNLIFSPRFALPMPAFQKFAASVFATALCTLASPYGYRYPRQLVMEFLGMTEGTQSAGDKAAYQSLAAHMTIFQVPAFHFVDFMEFMAVMTVALCVVLFTVTWPERDDQPILRDRVDFSVPALNLVFGLIYTWYLRTTFYWPPFFFYSAVYVFWLVGQIRGGKVPVPARGGPGFTPASGSLPDEEAGAEPEADGPEAVQVPEASPMDASVVLKALLVLGASFLFAWKPGAENPWWWLAPLLYLIYEYVQVPLGLAVALRVPPDANPLRPRASLATAALALFAFISIRCCYEAVLLPYSSSWCGFGITYWNPVIESEWIAKFNPVDKIYNDYDSGGWLIWKFYPKMKVMIDPRSFPYRDWYKDYIEYERGAHFKETIDSLGDKCNLSIVSLKNQGLWRSFLASGEWTPAWIGPSSVVFCRKGVEYPEAARQFAPNRFKEIKNSGRCLQVFQFCCETGLWDTAWAALDAMRENFHAPEEQALQNCLTDYKECILAMQKNDVMTAIQKQEACRKSGLFYSNQILYNLYDARVKQLMRSQSPEQNAEIANLTQKMERVRNGQLP